MFAGVKQASKSMLRRFGYEVYASGKGSIDYEAAATVKEAKYYSRWVGPCPLFSPWLGHPTFHTVYDGAQQLTIVSPDRCYILISLAGYAVHLPGDFAECGVYKGGTALMLARTLKGKADKKLYLFDSFRGLPKVDEHRDQWFSERDFSVESVQGIRNVLAEFDSIVDIRQGWIPETFQGLESNRYAFVHLDVDLYRSNLDCCNYFYSRVTAGGVMLFDEYGFAGARGEKDAVDEFFADKAECPITLPTGQALVLKLPLLVP